METPKYHQTTSMTPDLTSGYPVSSALDVDALRKTYVGLSLKDPEIATPALVMDRAVARRNCQRMLDACEAINVCFRAEMASHRTQELASLQVGAVGPARISASSPGEVQLVADKLSSSAKKGRRPMEILYDRPITKDDIYWLTETARCLADNNASLAVVISEPEQFELLRTNGCPDDERHDARTPLRRMLTGVLPRLLKRKPQATGSGTSSNHVIKAYLQVDHPGQELEEGYPTIDVFALDSLAVSAVAAHARGDVVLTGLYSHSEGHHVLKGAKYNDPERGACSRLLHALADLERQLQLMSLYASTIQGLAAFNATALPREPLVLSAGPTGGGLGACRQVLEAVGGGGTSWPAGSGDLSRRQATDGRVRYAVASLRWHLERIRSGCGFAVEMHAGEYATLDVEGLMQTKLMGMPSRPGDMPVGVLVNLYARRLDDDEYQCESHGEQVILHASLLDLGARNIGGSGSNDGHGWFTREAASPPRGDKKDGHGGQEAGGGCSLRIPTGDNAISTRDTVSVLDRVERSCESSSSDHDNDPGAGEDDIKSTPGSSETSTIHMEIEAEEGLAERERQTGWSVFPGGDRRRIPPDCAGLAGSRHRYYLVVDSDMEGKQDEIVDIWPRAGGTGTYAYELDLPSEQQQQQQDAADAGEIIT